ncbi:hypothetical protein [Parasphingorhabdus sp.]|uniref:hypothetical protein n=1 Tax=Parasphingorhabdus sp. TaxID=2709688 RepID=UPI003263C164
MKRIHPLILIIIFLTLVVGGVILKIIDAKRCMDQGGGVVAPMTRDQDCAVVNSTNAR